MSPTRVRIAPPGTRPAACRARTSAGSTAATSGPVGISRAMGWVPNRLRCRASRAIVRGCARATVIRSTSRLALAHHLGVRVHGAGEHVREHVEDRRQARGQPGPTDLEPLGIDGDAEVRAHAGQLVVDRDAVPGRGAGEQRRGEQLGGGEVPGDRGVVGLGGVRAERHPQPQFGHRHARVARDEHPQAGGQRDVQDVRQRHLAGGPERRAAAVGRRWCGRSPRRCGAPGWTR